MRIAVNTRFLLSGNMTGLGHYTYEIMKQLVQQHPEVEFLFLFDRSFDPKFLFAPNITPVVLFPPARTPLLFYFWFEWAVPKAIKKHKADLFISPDNFMSLRLDIPTLLVIHDLAFEHYPKDLSRNHLNYYKNNMPIFARKAARIVAVSHTTKEDIVEQYKINASRINVVHPGINAGFKRPEKNHLPGDYFIHLGTIQPRKNIVRLLSAFEQYKVQTSSSTQLIFIGSKGWKNKEIYSFYDHMIHKNDVLFEGYLTNEEISDKLSRAIGLLCVSYFEGFGMPVIEAQQCGCPVITSDVSSLPEAAGDAALFVDPFNEDEICSAMVHLAKDHELRLKLLHAGFENVKKYSWKKSATKLWDCVLKIMDEK